jgi:sulfite reductase (NADPH) flavoprotein alpha-component
MSQIPFIPKSAPFTSEQRQWLNGYLAGLFSDARQLVLESGFEAAQSTHPLLILYGSQTGTAEGVARRTAKAASAKGFAPKVLSLEKYESINLADEENVLLITSTYGDGEPPDSAQAFWQWLSGDSAPSLKNARFSVLALGDTNYPLFCEFGKRCDERLEQLGARRIQSRTDCDVDFESAALAWMENVFAALLGESTSSRPVLPAMVSAPEKVGSESSSGWSRTNPFPARLKVNRRLNADSSEKDVRHLEISLAGPGLTYEVGDALGVMPTNCPDLVSELLSLLGCDGEEAVPTPDGPEVPLRLALLQYYDITKPSPDLL